MMKQAKPWNFVIAAGLLAAVMGCSKNNPDAPVGSNTPGASTALASAGDAVITAKVKAALVKEPALKSTDIKVETNNGAVQLTGSVKSQADVDHAAEVAKQVEGVKAVKNDLQVKAA